MIRFLPERLLPWYEGNKRDLPWRQDRDAYHVWISEIMLQQTRVEAVKAYYIRFLQVLPTVSHLAEASEDVLLKLWEGLGYYSRVRNLQKAAKQICDLHGGVFPNDHRDILALPGIGPYTAGAISSICFEKAHAAVDGNVLRVLSRFTADASDITAQKVKDSYTERLESIYPQGRCGDFTQALMELGATVCLPNGSPLCPQCPLQDLCRAKAAGTQQEYPVKPSKKPRRREQRTVLILQREGKFALCKRPERGLLAGLWQFPDTEGHLNPQEAMDLAAEWELKPTELLEMREKEHIFTHVHWEMRGYYLRCAAPGSFFWYTAAELAQSIGLPTAYRQFLESK